MSQTVVMNNNAGPRQQDASPYKAETVMSQIYQDRELDLSQVPIPNADPYQNTRNENASSCYTVNEHDNNQQSADRIARKIHQGRPPNDYQSTERPSLTYKNTMNDYYKTASSPLAKKLAKKQSDLAITLEKAKRMQAAHHQTTGKKQSVWKKNDSQDWRVMFMNQSRNPDA